MAIEYVFVVFRLANADEDFVLEYYQDPLLASEGAKEFSSDKSTAMVFTTVKTAVRVADVTGTMVRVLLDKERPKFGGASEGNRP